MKIILAQTNYPGFLDSFYKSLPDYKNKSYSNIKRAWAREYFGSADFYMQNLKPLGWEGGEIVLNDWVMQSKWMKEHKFEIEKKDIAISKYIPQRIKNLLGLNGWMKEIFFKQIEFAKPDVLYMHDLTVLNERDIKKVKKYTKLMVGQIAYPLPLNESILKKYDLIISSFPHYVAKFREMGIKSEYLRWCAEKTIAKNLKNKDKTYDVSYVGGFTPHHSQGNKTLEKVASQLNVDFWGYGENFLLPNSPIKKNLHGNAWGKDMYDIFSKSKIVINRHINISKNYANNMRMFDATLMGALLITDSKTNMSEFFKVGKEVIVYKNSQDLVNKIRYYLSHEKERIKIAKAGQKRTMKDHSYKVRMKELDKILHKYLTR